MPYQPALDVETLVSTVPLVEGESRPVNWRVGLPTLTGSLVTLRELRLDDAASLFAALSSEEVTRFMSPAPPTLDGFERFIAWSHRQREAGQYVCFAMVPRGCDSAIGLIQIRSLEPDFGNAEWGFALAPKFWGTGMF